MSIFTTTVDHAIDRFTLEDGTEVAVGYDDMARSPFEDMDTFNGAAARRAERHYGFDGDTDLVEALDTWIDERDEILSDLEYQGITEDEAEDRLAELGEAPATVHRFEGMRGCNAPSWEVVVDKDFRQIHGFSEEMTAEKFAEEVQEAYSQWAEGEVYLLEITDPDGDVSYCGGIYGDVTPDNIHDYL